MLDLPVWALSLSGQFIENLNDAAGVSATGDASDANATEANYE